MITRCPIISDNANWDLEWEELEVQGPFVPTFLTDLKRFGPFFTRYSRPPACGST
jgi:hypothetical protein